MITIKCKRAEESFELTIEGHACYAPEGQDIVCAAVSVLIQALADSLDSVTESFNISFTKNQITKIKASGKNVRLVLNTILTGLTLVQAQYPDNVKLTVSPG